MFLFFLCKHAIKVYVSWYPGTSSCLALRNLGTRVSLYISVVPEATHEASQGFKTDTIELLGGMKHNNILPVEGSLISPSGRSMIFFTKSHHKEIEFVTRPGPLHRLLLQPRGQRGWNWPPSVAGMTTYTQSKLLVTFFVHKQCFCLARLKSVAN